MALRTGIAILTELVKHICRVLTTYRPAIDSLIAAAVGGSVITATQADILKTWLDGAVTACNILRSVSGY